MRITKDSKSDSALIGHLYQKLGDGPELWNMLDGVFACVLYDEATNEYIAARSALCRLCSAQGNMLCTEFLPESIQATTYSAVQCAVCLGWSSARVELEVATCRDPLGICPLYWGKGRDGSTWFSSEMKALQSCCVSFEIFPPVCPWLQPSVPADMPADMLTWTSCLPCSAHVAIFI